METYFYKFWENPFFKLDTGQKQMEDITRWMMGGLSSFEELSEKFGKLCSMDFWFKETDDYIKAWETTTEDIQNIFRDYLNLMGLVPKDEHVELMNQYKALNERVTDQAIEISSEISRQKEILADQKQMIMDQKKEIAKQKKLVADQKELVKVLKKEIAGQKNEISKQKKIVVDREEKLVGQKKIVAELKKEIAVQIKSIKQLQKQASA